MLLFSNFSIEKVKQNFLILFSKNIDLIYFNKASGVFVPLSRVEVFYNNLISLRMELITTFFIKFALGFRIILALSYKSLNKIEFIIKLNFCSTSNLFHQFSNSVIFSFSNPNRGFVDEAYCRV